ncbi:MAG: DUF6614 family protein [Pseudomonadota bacterium]
MDVYQIHCDLAPGMSDMKFARALDGWLGHLRDEGAVESFRLLRRKLGLSPAEFGEFQITIETRDLAQLDRAFALAAKRSGREEFLHHCVNHMVRNARFALYRDFPDPIRKVGEEAF